MEEVTDEPLYRDRVCGIDIGKAGLVATIRVPSDRDPARRMQETRSFGTTRREVLALADWLRCWQVPAVVMEATGDYWKGPFYRLEAEGFDCVLADAKQVKNLPGRPKRDPADSRWLAACFERGAITACFVATPEFRIIRLHTRYRRDLTEERTREKQRAEKLLESAAIKISSVVTDLHGVTGRDIMDHLIAGERNPKVLAQLARAAARRKISQLEEAAGGRGVLHRRARRAAGQGAGAHRPAGRRHRGPDPGDRAAAGPVRGTTAAGRVDARLGPPRRPGRRRRNRRRHEQVPHRAAPGLLGWPRPAGPPVRQARRTRQSQEGQPVPRRHPGETAVAAGRTQTREGARHRRLARRRGTAKACVATGNTQLKVYHKLLSNPGMRYVDLGPDYYDRQRDTRRQIAHHVGKLGSLGFEVTLCRIPNRTRRDRPDPGRLTHTAPAGPDRPRWPGSAAARPANLHFSG